MMSTGAMAVDGRLSVGDVGRHGGLSRSCSDSVGEGVMQRRLLKAGQGKGGKPAGDAVSCGGAEDLRGVRRRDVVAFPGLPSVVDGVVRRGRGRPRKVVVPAIGVSLEDAACWLNWEVAALERLVRDGELRGRFFPTPVMGGVDGVETVALCDVVRFLGAQGMRPLLRVGDVVRVLRKPYSTVYRWIVKEGRCRWVELPDGQVRVRGEDLGRWISAMMGDGER